MFGKKEKVTLTNMCMIYDGKGNVVVQDRVNPNWQGITFPGGHIEKGESFNAAVVREVFEETGLTISDVRLCGIKDWAEKGERYIVLLYKTDSYSGDLISSDEGEVKWLPISEMQKMKLPISMKEMLQVFLSDDLSEVFSYSENGEIKISLY